MNRESAAEPRWTCQTGEIPEAGLTVGSIFSLACGGMNAGELNPAALRLELGKEQQYSLKILQTKSLSATGAEFLITSYRTGDIKPNDVVLTDGATRIVLEGISFQVNSLIAGQNPPPEAYPPFGPVTMAWPLPVLLTLAAVAASLAGLSVALWRRRKQRQRFQNWLRETRTPNSPYDQLNKDLRQAMKQRQPLKQLELIETAMRRYLAHRFEQPTFGVSSRRLARLVGRGDHRRKVQLQSGLIRLFGELARAEKDKAMTGEQALNGILPQLHELARECAETIEEVASNKQKRRQP